MVEATTRSDRRALVVALILVALAFAGTFDNDFVNWDDGIYIGNNPLVTDPGSQTVSDRLFTPVLGYALPIPVLVYGWLWTLGGSAAWPFHAFNLGIHLLNVSVFYVLLRRFGCSPYAGGVAVIAFGAHPIVVESVAWATGLKDLLATTGALLAMLGFRRGLWALPGALLAFASKPTSILLALPLWACSRVGPKDTPPRHLALATVGLVAALGVALAGFTVTQETEALRTSSREAFSMARVFEALGLQLQHVLAPGTLAPRYAPSLAGPVELVLGVLGSALAAWLLIQWTRNRDSRLPWLVLAAAAYAPVSNLHPLERFTADSYFYLPWLAIVACLAMTWPPLAGILLRRSESRLRLVRGFVVVVCLAWAGLTAVQVEVWSDSRSLWRDCFLVQPDDPETIYRYGDALGRAGELDKELAIYLEHETDLERGERIPVVLVVYYERANKPQRAMHWYRIAFGSEVAQDDGMYWHYVEFIGRAPQQHDPRLDAALRYGLAHYVRAGRVGRLDPQQRTHLAAQAQRLRLPAVAAALSKG